MAEKIFPYELPKNWQWTTLGEICELSNGEKLSDKEFPYLDVKYLRGTKEKNLVGSGNFISEGTKVILVDGENSGEIFTVFENGYLGSTLRELKIFENVDADFFQYFVSTKKNLYRQNKKGSAIPHLNKNLFYSTLFPLPPIDEQKKIVERIESLFSKLDAAKEKVQTVLDGYELRRSAILHKAFTGELSKKFRAENNLSLDDWHEVTMDDIFTLKAGKNISATEISSVQTPVNQYPCFGGNGIRGFVNSYNSEGNFPIIGRQGALCGNINMATGKFYATEHAVVVTFKKKIESKWAENYLRYLNLNQYATATAQPGLAVKKILKVKINYIPFAEQKEIVRVLGSLLVKEQRTKEIAEKILSDIDLLKKSILARAFRGEL